MSTDLVGAEVSETPHSRAMAAIAAKVTHRPYSDIEILPQFPAGGWIADRGRLIFVNNNKVLASVAEYTKSKKLVSRWWAYLHTPNGPLALIGKYKTESEARGVLQHIILFAEAFRAVM